MSFYSEAVRYSSSPDSNTIIAELDPNSKTLVLRELTMLGSSLTNSIELAVSATFRHFYSKYYGELFKLLVNFNLKDWTILQDCKHEGYFKVTFQSDFSNICINPKWEFYSKDLTAHYVLNSRGEDVNEN